MDAAREASAREAFEGLRRMKEAALEADAYRAHQRWRRLFKAVWAHVWRMGMASIVWEVEVTEDWHRFYDGLLCIVEAQEATDGVTLFFMDTAAELGVSVVNRRLAFEIATEGNGVVDTTS